MDIFAIDSPTVNVNGNLQNPTVDDVFDQIPEVRFETGNEFNLNFFDNPDDSNTLGGYSDPGSVESASIGSPPPTNKSYGGNNGGVTDGNATFQLCQATALKCGKFNRWLFLLLLLLRLSLGDVRLDCMLINLHNEQAGQSRTRCGDVGIHEGNRSKRFSLRHTISFRCEIILFTLIDFLR